MPNPENIIPHKFKPGQTGNPNGRPKKLPELDRLLADVFGDDQMEKVLKAIYAKALKGDTRAAEIILDRGYGKAKESVQLEVTETVKSYSIVPASQRKGNDSK